MSLRERTRPGLGIIEPCLPSPAKAAPSEPDWIYPIHRIARPPLLASYRGYPENLKLLRPKKIGSKETAMPMRRCKRKILAHLLIGASAAMFGACVIFQHAQAQPGFVPPPTPLPPPVFNPSNPSPIPQPPYTPITPTRPGAAPGYVVTSPVGERLPRTSTHSHRASAEKTRSVHHHRGRFAGITWPSYCGSSPCVRIVVDEPPPVYRASVLWWPGYADYAPGQYGRGRPRWGGYPRYSGYHGD
jgi:hypothetical protein